MVARSDIRVLLVEDEMLIRELAAEDLADAGFTVVTATTGDEALVLVEQDRDFQLLFTDIHMPGEVDGMALVALAREILPDLPVIYATGLSDAPGDLGPLERFVRKPYVFEDVLRLMVELRVVTS